MTIQERVHDVVRCQSFTAKRSANHTTSLANTTRPAARVERAPGAETTGRTNIVEQNQ